MEKISRNENVDILRGVAMLLVLLGHTMTGVTEGAQDIFLFQVIWSLQMPLFILISGYVTRYSKPINSLPSLKKILWKRTVAYLLPWCVWSFLVRGFIFQRTYFLNIRWILWHMDSGYWFLFTLWMIVVIFTLSKYVANRVSNGKIVAEVVVESIIYIIGMGGLVGLGALFGMSFLAIKLTLYYMPFYYIGHLYGRFQNKINSIRSGGIVVEIISAMCLVIWLVIITRVNLYYSEDGGLSLMIRAIASLTGCVAVCSLVKSNKKQSNVCKFLEWVGKNSMGIYTAHYLLLNLLRTTVVPKISSMQGVGIVAVNYTITLLLLIVAVAIINRNRVLRLLLVGKT